VRFLILLSAIPVLAQEAPSRAELLEALSNAAATFARTAPGLGAREILEQRARLASIDILKGSEKDLKKIEVHLPEEFTSHEVESTWGLTQEGVLHESRKLRRIDSKPVGTQVSSRHALTLAPQSPDDDAKKRLLEDLEHGQLHGAAADFAPMLVLFTAARQSDFEFSPAGPGILRYKQIGGDDAFTEFRDRAEKHARAEGNIWFRQPDLLPLRITIANTEQLSVDYVLRNEAEVNYTPTPYGLAPSLVVHRQFLNEDLLVENKFRYSDYTGRPLLP
jgi:hypothetical protein